jgi:hypothetical protein
MPYGYVLLAATLVLTIRHVRSAHASNRSKGLVGGLAVVSVLAPYLWPSFFPFLAFVALVCLLLQFAVCFYVIFHQAVWCPDDEHTRASRTLPPTSPSEKASAEDH